MRGTQVFYQTVTPAVDAPSEKEPLFVANSEAHLCTALWYSEDVKKGSEAGEEQKKEGRE